MRHILTILLLTYFSLTCFGQKQNIDTLISKIDNKQIVVVTQYVWYPKMFSPAGETLIKIGKPLTNKLIPLLSDTNKGIVTQFILTTIWNKDLQKAGWKTESYVRNIKNNRDTVNEIYFSGLTFYQNNNLKIFARQDELDRNKNKWLKFIKTKSSR